MTNQEFFDSSTSGTSELEEGGEKNIQYPTLNKQCSREEKREEDRRGRKRTSNIQHSMANVQGKRKKGRIVNAEC
jgi:hypothetical protein